MLRERRASTTWLQQRFETPAGERVGYNRCALYLAPIVLDGIVGGVDAENRRRAGLDSVRNTGGAMLGDIRDGVIGAGETRPASNRSLIADCPLHEGRGTLTLYPSSLVAQPRFICFGYGERGMFAENRDGSFGRQASR